MTVVLDPRDPHVWDPEPWPAKVDRVLADHDGRLHKVEDWKLVTETTFRTATKVLTAFFGVSILSVVVSVLTIYVILTHP